MTLIKKYVRQLLVHHFMVISFLLLNGILVFLWIHILFEYTDKHMPNISFKKIYMISVGFWTSL